MNPSYIKRPKFRIKTHGVQYRFYFDSATGIGTHKSCAISEEPRPFIIVDKELYDSIEFCPNYRVIDNLIEKIKIDNGILKYIRAHKGRIRTTVNNLLFLQKDLGKPADTWDLK